MALASVTFLETDVELSQIDVVKKEEEGVLHPVVTTMVSEYLVAKEIGGS